MIKVVEEGLENYKNELRRYWQDYHQAIESYGHNYRAALDMGQDFEHFGRMSILFGMQKALGLTEKEVNDLCKEAGVMMRTWKC